jgi:hypothetical protein
MPQRSDEEIVSGYLRDGKLRILPKKLSRKLLVLRWIAHRFALGTRYAEKEVNEMLTALHPDYAMLRRALVDHRFMSREAGVYWKEPPEDSGA